MYAVATKSASELLDGVFDDLVRCETRLYNATGERLRADHGIVTSQFEFLRYLRDHPGARVVDLAAKFAAGIGSISKGADRLVARGWVRRLPNPDDGRSYLLSLTADGLSLVQEAEETLRAQLVALIVPTVSLDQVETLASTLATIRAALERDRVGLPVG
jgi:MarR family multiple antibiotic resistance transcriptional regulator